MNDLDKAAAAAATAQLTPEELADLKELLENYRHSRWVTVAVLKIAKWIAAVVGAIVAYKILQNGGAPLK